MPTLKAQRQRRRRRRQRRDHENYHNVHALHWAFAFRGIRATCRLHQHHRARRWFLYLGAGLAYAIRSDHFQPFRLSLDYASFPFAAKEQTHFYENVSLSLFLSPSSQLIADATGIIEIPADYYCCKMQSLHRFNFGFCREHNLYTIYVRNARGITLKLCGVSRFNCLCCLSDDGHEGDSITDAMSVAVRNVASIIMSPKHFLKFCIASQLQPATSTSHFRTRTRNFRSGLSHTRQWSLSLFRLLESTNIVPIVVAISGKIDRLISPAICLFCRC